MLFVLSCARAHYLSTNDAPPFCLLTFGAPHLESAFYYGGARYLLLCYFNYFFLWFSDMFAWGKNYRFMSFRGWGIRICNQILPYLFSGKGKTTLPYFSFDERQNSYLTYQNGTNYVLSLIFLMFHKDCMKHVWHKFVTNK